MLLQDGVGSAASSIEKQTTLPVNIGLLVADVQMEDAPAAEPHETTGQAMFSIVIVGSYLDSVHIYRYVMCYTSFFHPVSKISCASFFT